MWINCLEWQGKSLRLDLLNILHWSESILRSLLGCDLFVSFWGENYTILVISEGGSSCTHFKEHMESKISRGQGVNINITLQKSEGLLTYDFNLKSTVAHKCTPNLNHSHRIQITQTEFKLLTPNSNHSHRIQITHTEFKSLTPNLNHSHRIQITHTEFKSLTPNSKHSHQIQIQVTHTKFKIFKIFTYTKFLNSINQFHMYWIHWFCMSYINVVQQTSLSWIIRARPYTTKRI